MNDLKLFQRLQRRDETALVELGKKYQEGFVNWARPVYHFKEEILYDFFMDALLDFYEKIIAGKFENRDAVSVKNYLFTLFKNKLVNKVIQSKTRKELQTKADVASTNWLNNSDVESDFFAKEKASIIAKCMSDLGGNCQRILHLFYYEKMVNKEIATELGYENAQTVKAKKYQCLQKLKKIVTTAYEKADF